MEELVSIIIPVKGECIFLNRCLESVVNQKYKNIEIIIVLENVLENENKLCNYYKKIDKRVKIKTKTNKMIENLKNIGIEYSHGTYLVFMNPFDKLDKNFISDHIYYAINFNCDIISSITCLNKNNKSVKHMIYENKDIMKNYMLMNIRSTTKAKLFKKNLFKDISFLNDEYFDDFQIMYKVYDKAKIIMSISLKQYYKEEINLKISDKEYMKKINYCIEMLKFIELNYKSLANYCKSKICCEAIDIMKKISDSDYKKELYEYIKLYRKYAITDTKLPRHVRNKVMKSVLGYNMLNMYLNLEK